jgi:hypothetical protein
MRVFLLKRTGEENIVIFAIIADEEQLKYLRHVFEAYTRGGIPATELVMAAHAFDCLENVAEIPQPPVSLGAARITEMSPEKLVLETVPPEPPHAATSYGGP